jgi:hypothetical protein
MDSCFPVRVIYLLQHVSDKLLCTGIVTGNRQRRYGDKGIGRTNVVYPETVKPTTRL